MDFFELSKVTIRHYTYSPFSLYTLYVQTQKKRAESESVRLKISSVRLLNRLQPLIDIDDNLGIRGISVFVTTKTILPNSNLVQRW